jgi:hypothetical protein
MVAKGRTVDEPAILTLSRLAAEALTDRPAVRIAVARTIFFMDGLLGTCEYNLNVRGVWI